MYSAVCGPCAVSGGTIRKKVCPARSRSISPGAVADGLTATKLASEYFNMLVSAGPEKVGPMTATTSGSATSRWAAGAPSSATPLSSDWTNFNLKGRSGSSFATLTAA